MDKRRYVLYVALTAIVVGFIYLFFLNMREDTSTLGLSDQRVRPTSTQQLNKSVVHLYFTDKENSFLSSEKRILMDSDDPAELGRIIIESLIRGPREDLMRTIPAETTLRALFITQDGTAYVDMTKAVTEKHPGGSKSELMTIYSIVNSLILNIPEIDAVKILIEGCESMTLAGHIDTRFPFKANMLLIR